MQDDLGLYEHNKVKAYKTNFFKHAASRVQKMIFLF